MRIVQHEEFSCSIDANDVLLALECFSIFCVHLCKLDNVFITIERSDFISTNASINLLEITVSPLFAFNFSHLQQQLPNFFVK